MKPAIDGTFGGRVRGRRRSLRWSLDELARRTGLSKSFLSGLEVGRKRPGADTLLKLSQELGVPMDALMGSDGRGVPGGYGADARPDGVAEVATEIPGPLADLARAADLSFRSVHLLLGLAKVVCYHNRRSLDGFDWRRFHEAVEDWT